MAGESKPLQHRPRPGGVIRRKRLLLLLTQLSKPRCLFNRLNQFNLCKLPPRPHMHSRIRLPQPHSQCSSLSPPVVNMVRFRAPHSSPRKGWFLSRPLVILRCLPSRPARKLTIRVRVPSQVFSSRPPCLPRSRRHRHRQLCKAMLRFPFSLLPQRRRLLWQSCRAMLSCPIRLLRRLLFPRQLRKFRLLKYLLNQFSPFNLFALQNLPLSNRPCAGMQLMV